jgi:cysteine synthase
LSSILDAIGNTPLVRLTRCAPPNGAELWLKLEYANPTGSLKDRMALAMVEGAERDGAIAPGDTIVEYTGGSTGPALALVCRAKRYRCLIVIADCFTEERFQWDPDRVDHVEPIEDDAALEMTLHLSREEGVFAGISTGANVVGAHRLAERLGPDAVIVTLAADSGFKYMSTPPYAALDAG